MSVPTFVTGPMGPAAHCFAITPHATNAQPPMKALRANTAGTVTLRMQDSGADVTLDLDKGEYVVGLVTHIRVAGTTATLHGFA